MTLYEYVCQQWPNHAQRIIEATKSNNALAQDVSVDDTPHNVLSTLFVWSWTVEGHAYWRELANGEVKVLARYGAGL